MGLRGKIFSAFFGILALLMGGTIYYTNTQTTEFQTAQITGQLRSTRTRFEKKFENERANTLKLVRTITSDQKYRSFLQQVKDNYFSFAEEISMDTKADMVFVIDEEMAVRGVCPAPSGVKVNRDEHIARIMEQVEEPHVDGLLAEILDTGKNDSRVMVFGGKLTNMINVPLKESLSDDYALGVVSVGLVIDDAWVNDLLKDESLGVQVIFHIDGDPVAANVPPEQSRAVLKAAMIGTGESFDFRDERFIRLQGKFGKAGRPAGYLFVASLDKAMVPFVSLQWKIFSLGLAALLVGLVVIMLMTNRIVFPIRLLVRGTREIMDGNYDYTVENKSKDEVGQLARAFNHMTGGLKEKEQIRNLFGKYVHPSIVSDIMENPENLQQGGTRRVQTLLFSDIAGFTTISEGMDAEELVGFLNEYLGAMADELTANDGILDKYLGDGIMAFWGPPLTKGNHAVLACNAALGMQIKLDDMRRDWQARGLPPIHARIGVATGEVIVGNIGSEQAQDYTCIGDTVNLASRLEGVNKAYRTDIIVDEATLDMAEGKFRTRELDTVRVKGREGGTRIFELRGFASGANSELEGHCQPYADALVLYRAGDFKGALKAFQSFEDDAPSAVMAEACRHLIEEPPEHWDGIHTLTEK
ncbi:MAG: adenylate/guanylate cyclase domain-containing protein [Alphaproteobacteria bacterium]|nr:adenylate/guanylate cyclase domain-containing protein [Alphaproteobacteria bacterium]